MLASFPVETGPPIAVIQPLVNETIEGEKGDLVEDVLPYLKLVHVLDPDAEFRDLPVEPVLDAVDAHPLTRSC